MSRAMTAASSRRSNGPRSRCSTAVRVRRTECFGHEAASSGIDDRSRTRSTKMPGVTTVSGSMVAGFDDTGDLDDGQLRGGRHHRAEVACGLAVQQVSRPVGDVSADQCDVPADRVLQHVVAAVDGAGLLAVGQRGADTRRAEERADARTGGSHPLGQVALRNHLECDLAVPIQRVEHVRIRLPGKRTDHPADATGGQQGGQTGVAIARVVADDGQIRGAVLDQCVDERRGHARHAEATDEDRCAVLDSGDGIPGVRIEGGAAHDGAPPSSSNSGSTSAAMRNAEFASGTPQ